MDKELLLQSSDQESYPIEIIQRHIRREKDFPYLQWLLCALTVAYALLFFLYISLYFAAKGCSCEGYDAFPCEYRGNCRYFSKLNPWPCSIGNERCFAVPV